MSVVRDFAQRLSTIASNGFECYSESARGRLAVHNSFDSSRFCLFFSEFKPFWFKNQAQLRIYGERICNEFSTSFLQVYGDYVLTEFYESID